MTRSSVVRVAFALTGAGGLAAVTLGQRDALAALAHTTHPGTLAAAIALLAVAPLLQAATFLVALRRLGVAPRPGRRCACGRARSCCATSRPGSSGSPTGCASANVCPPLRRRC